MRRKRAQARKVSIAFRRSALSGRAFSLVTLPQLNNRLHCLSAFSPFGTRAQARLG